MGWTHDLTIFFVSFLLFFGIVSGELSPTFYGTSCPDALSIIKTGIKDAISKENRIGASLLRMFFHDCFVLGCDASVLLDDTTTLKGEKHAPPNNNSLRGFEVIDSVKAQVEMKCAKIVSCADIIAIAARDSVVELGGPSWPVELGRRDSTTASFDHTLDLPSPFSSLTDLISAFKKKGLSTIDMVALSGAHTIGYARCVSFKNRIYNETNINPRFAIWRKMRCPKSGGDNNLAPLDFATSADFDNFYYMNLERKVGLLHSDQVLLNVKSTDTLVRSYSHDTAKFYKDFTIAMMKMGRVNVLTGRNGEIRVNCRKVN